MPALNLTAAALYVAAASIYGLTTLSAAVPRWLVVFLWASVASVVFLCHLWRNSKIELDEIDWAAIALIAWCALSLSWSSDWRQGVVNLTCGAALFCIFQLVRSYPDLIPEAALAGVVVALVLYFMFPEDWGGHGNRNFQTEAIVIGLCLALETKRAWIRALWVPVCVVSAWLLLVENPSKIEFYALAAIVMWKAYEWRKLLKFRRLAA